MSCTAWKALLRNTGKSWITDQVALPREPAARAVPMKAIPDNRVLVQHVIQLVLGAPTATPA